MSDNAISRIDQTINALDATAYSTIDTADPKNAIKVVSALTGAESLTKSGVTEFTLVDVVFKPNQIVDSESGEVTDIEDVYLFADDGRIFYSRSRGVFNSVKMICAFVPAPFAIPVRVKTTQTGRGMYKQLVPVSE